MTRPIKIDNRTKIEVSIDRDHKTYDILTIGHTSIKMSKTITNRVNRLTAKKENGL